LSTLSILGATDRLQGVIPRTIPTEDAVKYLCIVHQDEAKLAAMSPADLDALVGDCIAWIDDLERGGHHVISAGLQSARTATIVQSRGGKVTVTDGPYAETKEQLGGFTLIEARDLNEAIQLASRLPATRIGSVEVRPLLAFDAEMSEALDRKLGASMQRIGRAAKDHFSATLQTDKHSASAQR
jgi:hypothetical protein